MSTTITLLVDIESYWRAGTGRGSTGRLDAVCARDNEGLPYLPGRTIKGLLRDAVERAERWGWFDADGYPAPNAGVAPLLTERLFGQVGFVRGVGREFDTLLPIRATSSGCLTIGNARLPQCDRLALAEEPELRRHLFATVNTTAVDPDSGSALEKSLRAEEVVVPLCLEAEISAIDHRAPANWIEVLDRALTLVRSVGGGRSRGLGRCILAMRRANP